MEDRDLSKDWPHEWIKKIRSRPAKYSLSKKMRQVDLAKKVGVDPRTIQQWENGDRLPSISNLKILIQVFVEEGLFLEGAQHQEAEALWLAVKRFSEARSVTNREFPDFDKTWFESITLHEGTVQEEDSSSATPSHITHNQFGVTSSLFVGRKQNIVDLQEGLQTNFLVSIVGPGGIGKTTLAMKIASTCSEKYQDGVWMFEFGTMKDQDSLSQFLLSTMGLQNQVNRSDVHTILDVVSDKRMLFIFDNCEHVIDACADLIETLLGAAPNLHILVTSRESLNIHGEYIYRLPPLSYPEDETTLSYLSEEDIRGFEAVQLFLDRAHLVVPELKLTLDRVKLIGAICKKLEGIPLAIEIAASRIGIITLEQMEQRLASQLTLLTGGKRNAAPRQKTLKATIDWSYGLLTSKEQLLLKRLSIFSGGFTLEAVEQICSCEPTLTTHHDNNKLTIEDMLDLLSGLANKSLISIKNSDDYGYLRYFMLEAIKEYASEKLYEGADEAKINDLHERHFQYYSELLKDAESKFRTQDRDACLAEVSKEYGNLHEAMHWCYQHRHAHKIGLHIVSNLYWFWLHEGRLEEGRLWLDRILDSPMQEEMPSSELVKAFHGRGVMYFVQNKIPEAIASASRSIELAREINDLALLSSSLRLMAFIHINQLQLEQAESLIKESVDIARNTHDMWNLAASLHAYGVLKLKLEMFYEASILLKESVHFFEAVNDKWEISGPYESLGYAALKLGEIDQAIEWFKKSIAISQIYKGTWVLSRGIEGLAIALWTKKDYREAAILISAAEKYREGFGEATVPNFPKEHNIALLDLKHVLDEQEIEQFWSKGKSLTKDQILAYSLEV